MDLRRTIKEFNSEAFWAGISAFVFMVFGALTLQISIIERFNLPSDLAHSWIVVTWLLPGLTSLVLVLRYRQPLSVGWTIPGLVYMGSLADRFSFNEMVTANLVAGGLIVLLGLVGAGERVIRLIPMPILMSMFAASMIEFVVRAVNASATDAAIGAPMVAAYLVGRVLNHRQVPPVALSVITGGVLVLMLGQTRAAPIGLEMPVLATPGFDLSARAVLTITLPMVLLVVGLGNGQGLGFLVSQGYRVPANLLTGVIGLLTMLHALFGGHPAAMTRTASAMLAGPAAGPRESRYWSSLIAFALVTLTSCASGLLVAIVAMLPAEYILIVAGLAILPAFQDALGKAFDGHLMFGSMVAFVVTLSGSFTVAGIPSAFWAVLAGVGASLVLERAELRSYWASPRAAAVEAPKIPAWRQGVRLA